jgi:sarcosine oxidase subunit beta
VEGYLPDLKPVIGWSGTLPGLVHAFGFSGRGFQLAPGIGAAVADLIAAGASAIPLEAFSISRFAGGAIAHEKLWAEFDPELVADAKRASPGAGGQAG